MPDRPMPRLKSIRPRFRKVPANEQKVGPARLLSTIRAGGESERVETSPELLATPRIPCLFLAGQMQPAGLLTGMHPYIRYPVLMQLVVRLISDTDPCTSRHVVGTKRLRHAASHFDEKTCGALGTFRGNEELQKASTASSIGRSWRSCRGAGSDGFAIRITQNVLVGRPRVDGQQRTIILGPHSPPDRSRGRLHSARGRFQRSSTKRIPLGPLHHHPTSFEWIFRRTPLRKHASTDWVWGRCYKFFSNVPFPRPCKVPWRPHIN